MAGFDEAQAKEQERRAREFAERAERKRRELEAAMEANPIDWSTSLEKIEDGSLKKYKAGAEDELRKLLANMPGGPRPS